MARPAPGRPVLAALAALFIAALAVTGCVSMPTGGPVQSYPVTQGTAGQNQPYVELQPQPPGTDWTPQQIVEGFLAASASFGDSGQVVQQYLTPQEREDWKTDWSAIVYKNGPTPSAPTYAPAGKTAKTATTATVYINGTIQASLLGSGSYSVPSASSQGNASSIYEPDPFELERVGGQWRISYAPPKLLLTSNAFQDDYQLRDLYFFDPAGSYLVPDPVYVPLEATAGDGDLIHGLVQDLITPPADWLSEGKTKATKTAFPAGTEISGVTLNGVTAVVNLTGAITKATTATMQQVSAQLLWTLRGAAQGGQPVQSVEVQLDGKPWFPPNKQDNPVQQTPAFAPPTGASTKFYYVDSAGYLTSYSTTDGTADRLAKIGTGYSQIAVSPDGNYVAALRGSTLYAGLIGGPLLKRASGFVAMSWDVNGDLWASAGSSIVMFRGSAGAEQPLGQMVPVTVVPNSNLDEPPFTLIKVAPDGVRVAIVQDGNVLTFGAISGRLGPHPQISLSTVQEAPPTSAQSDAVVNFTALAWYGSDDVITLAAPGPAVTEYPVSGGTPNPIPADPDMQTVAASYNQPLIAGFPKGQLASDASFTGSWMPINDVDTPVIGTFPAYPG